MDIAQSPVPAMAPSAPVKTEYSANPAEKPVAAPKKEESFGSTLNRMAGVQGEKDLYKKDAKNEMSKEAYLKMMMEQIKYQDPFNPIKNEQFTQNMAMMSQLEQQINMNKNLEKMMQQNNNMQIAALQLVGKTIQADSASLFHEAGKFTNVSFKLPQDAKDLAIEIVGPTGEALKTIPMGTQNAGEINTKWDGLMENGQPLPSGKYAFRIRATDMEDKQISIPSKVEGRVTGVTNSQGVTFLLVGERRVALNEVEVIKEDDGKVTPSAGIADFVNAKAPAVGANVPVAKTSTSAAAALTSAPAKTANKYDEDDEDTSGTKVATEVHVDAATEKQLEDAEAEESPIRRGPIQKESLNDLMQVMFR